MVSNIIDHSDLVAKLDQGLAVEVIKAAVDSLQHKVYSELLVQEIGEKFRGFSDKICFSRVYFPRSSGTNIFHESFSSNL